ncbi:hypothetical protein ACH4EC_12410 [Streptomyces anulatus]
MSEDEVRTGGTHDTLADVMLPINRLAVLGAAVWRLVVDAQQSVSRRQPSPGIQLRSEVAAVRDGSRGSVLPSWLAAAAQE